MFFYILLKSIQLKLRFWPTAPDKPFRRMRTSAHQSRMELFLWRIKTFKLRRDGCEGRGLPGGGPRRRRMFLTTDASPWSQRSLGWLSAAPTDDDPQTNVGFKNEERLQNCQERRSGCYLQHVCRLLAPLSHVLRLGQQVVQEPRLVQLADELALKAVLHVVDQEMHHGLWHAGAGDRWKEVTFAKEEAGLTGSAMNWAETRLWRSVKAKSKDIYENEVVKLLDLSKKKDEKTIKIIEKNWQSYTIMRMVIKLKRKYSKLWKKFIKEKIILTIIRK